MKQINIYEAKAQLSDLVERAAAGEEIIIAKAGKPRALLVPLPPSSERKSGRGKGKIQIGDEFDAPLPEDLASAFDATTRPRKRR